MTLTHAQAKKFYDHFGSKQDSQAFYEDAALNQMAAHAAFDQAESVFELGCGTGRFAYRLLQDLLPASATYLGIDLSETMISLARQRLIPYDGRARVIQSDGTMHFPLPDSSVDRVIATYVLDLLSESDIKQALADAHRILAPNGKLCLMSLTCGVSVLSHIVSSIWSFIYRLRAPLVGGCRPVQLHDLLEPDNWLIEYHQVITQFGVPSEILIATPITGKTL
jgi:ubiquinone/menaquinone biosynthesis C-methylase UbiE